MTTTPTTRLPRIWIIWVGVLLTAVMAVLMLAWWLLPRWAPELVIQYAPWPEPALRAWRLDSEDGVGLVRVQVDLERRLLDWGPDIGPALLREFVNGKAKHRLSVVALASEVARADGIAAGTTLPEDRRQQFSAEDIQLLREDLVQLVLAAFADGSSYLPSNASYVAMSLRDPRTVPPACAFLAKQKPPIFEDLEPVIRFLGTMRDPRAVPVLIPLLPIRHKPHPTVDEAVLACLDDSSVNDVIAATHHAHEVVRTWAAKRFPRFAASLVLRERMIALIADPVRQVAMSAMVGVVEHLPGEAGPVLLAVAKTSTDEEIQLLAIIGLGSLAYEPAKPFLRDQAATRRDWCGKRAILSLGVFKDPQDVDLLLSLLAQPEVVEEVLMTLAKIPLTDAQRQQVDAARAAQPVSPQ